MNNLHPSNFRTFATAGRAVFTVTSPSGSHMTFRVSRSRKDKDRPDAPLFVSVRTAGPDGLWSYLGMIGRNGFQATKATAVPVSDLRFRAFAWFWTMQATGKAWPPGLKIQHEGCCGRCARKLTDPDSIDRGLGPECAGMAACRAA